jgi:DNA-binding beta-propeller fold protein YncE
MQMGQPTIFRACSSRVIAWLAPVALLLVAGCGHDAGVIFPPLVAAPQWPSAPEQPRIRYVGQLTGSRDLKPAVSAFQAFGSAVFGGASNDHSFQSPMAICTDGADRVFVADSADHVVHVLDLKSRAYQRWAPTGRQMLTPVGLAYDANGRRLLVSDSGAATIFIFSLDGKYLGEFASGQVKRPCGLAVDPRNGRVFVADVATHQVVVLSPAGDVIERLGARGASPGQFNYPTNVAIDGQGRLYVSDSLNFRIQQFSTDLEPTRQIGSHGDMPGYFAEPKGVAIDPDGHLYVVDAQFEAVELFNDTGNLLLDFGEEGHAPGEFWLPCGIFIDGNGRIWVADSYNHRVQVFDYLPERKP